MSALAVPTAGVVEWAAVDGGLWVAQVAGTHLGRVDTDERNRFHAYSAHSVSLGSYPSLAAAKSAVETQRTYHRRVAGQRMLVIVTAAAGVAAVGMGAFALLSGLV